MDIKYTDATSRRTANGFSNVAINPRNGNRCSIRAQTPLEWPDMPGVNQPSARDSLLG